MSGLEAKIQNESKVIKNLKAEIERRKQGLHEDQNVIKRQSSKITRMEGELDFAEALRLDLVSQRDALHGKLEGLKTQNKDLGAKLKEATGELKAQNQALVALQGKLSRSETQTAALQTQLAAAQQEARSAGARARQANKELRGSVKALKTANKQEAAKSQRLESKLEQALLKAADAQAQSQKLVGRLKDKIGGLQSEIGSRERAIAELETTVESQRKALLEGQDTQADQRAQLGKLERTLEGLRHSLSSTRTQLETSTAQLRRTEMRTVPWATTSAMTDDRDALDALLDKNTSHMKTLIAILAAKGGAINCKPTAELQDILRGYERRWLWLVGDWGALGVIRMRGARLTNRVELAALSLPHEWRALVGGLGTTKTASLLRRLDRR